MANSTPSCQPGICLMVVIFVFLSIEMIKTYSHLCDVVLGANVWGEVLGKSGSCHFPLVAQCGPAMWACYAL